MMSNSKAISISADDCTIDAYISEDISGSCVDCYRVRSFITQDLQYDKTAILDVIQSLNQAIKDIRKATNPDQILSILSDLEASHELLNRVIPCYGRIILDCFHDGTTITANMFLVTLCKNDEVSLCPEHDFSDSSGKGTITFYDGQSNIKEVMLPTDLAQKAVESAVGRNKEEFKNIVLIVLEDLLHAIKNTSIRFI